jgi:hypothetical protein
MPANTINLYEDRDLTEYVQMNPGSPRFISSRLFQNIRRFNSSAIQIDLLKGGRKTPVYVNPTDDGNMIEHEGYTTHEYRPPYYHERKIVKPTDFDSRRAGETPYDYTAPVQKHAIQLLEDLDDLNNRLNRLLELQAIEGVTTGKLIVKDKDGATLDTIDFNMNSDHKPILPGAEKWTAAAITKNAVLKNLRDWNTNMLVKDGGRSVGVIVMGSDALAAFIAKVDPDNEISGISSIRVDRGEIRPELLPNGVTYVGSFRELGGADIFGYSEWYEDPFTGETAPIFPTNKVLMIGAGARFDQNYAKIQNTRALIGVERFAWQYLDPKGKADEVHLESAPLLTPYEIDCVVCAQVV